jgi:hypothetical protein
MSNVGESYAGGGIVAFKTGDEVEDSAFVRTMKQLKEKFSGPSEEERKIREAQRYFKQQASGKGAFTQSATDYDAARAVNDFVQANPSIVNSPVFRADPAGYVARSAENQRNAKPATMSPEELRSENMRLAGKIETAEIPEVNQPAAPQAVKPAAPAAPAAKKPAAKPQITKTTDQPSIANLPTVAALLPPELPDPVKGSPRDILSKSMVLDPDVESKRILAERERLVGAPDTSQYQALIEELRGQRSKLQEKKEPGFESLMEYFNEIAAGPTVGRSGQAGAQASARLRQRALEKEKQANALSERMIEAAQKQQDAVYGYKKEGFALSEGERARVFKERFDSAKAAGESDDRARQMAQQAVLERERLKQQAELERERNAATIKAAGISSASRQGQLMEIAQALMKADKTGKLDYRAALEQAAKIVGTSALAGAEVRNDQAFDAAKKTLDEGLLGILRRGKGVTAQNAQRDYEIELAKLEKRYNQTGAAGLNSLPATNAGVKILSIEPSPK